MSGRKARIVVRDWIEQSGGKKPAVWTFAKEKDGSERFFPKSLHIGPKIPLKEHCCSFKNLQIGRL